MIPGLLAIYLAQATGPAIPAKSIGLPPGPIAPLAPARQPPAPARVAPRRVVVVPRGPELAEAAAQVEARLAERGAQVVKLEAVLAALRTQAAALPGWHEAQAARLRGLDAEQNLDLDSAVAALAQAREGLLAQGAAWLDPAGLAQVNLELARCQDERGDAAASREALLRWAELGPPELDEKGFPPPFVAASRAARAQVSAATPSGVAPRRTQAPLSALWSSGLVDEVVAVDPAGLPGGEDLTLLLYRKGGLRPERFASVARVGTPAEQKDWLDRGIQGLGLPGAAPLPPPLAPVSATPASAAPAEQVTAPAKVEPPPNELANPVSIQAGFVFPAAHAYTHYDVSTTDIGLELGARVALPFGQLGGRLDLLTGYFGIAQLTPTVRWEWRKARWGFDVEPGIFLQVRRGVTKPVVQGPFDGTNTSTTGDPTYLVFGAEAGVGLGFHFTESWKLEEQITVGAVLAGNYDLNMPVAVHTRVIYTF